jgi:hypothetical protein
LSALDETQGSRRLLWQVAVSAGIALLLEWIVRTLLEFGISWASPAFRADLAALSTLLEELEPLSRVSALAGVWAWLAWAGRRPAATSNAPQPEPPLPPGWLVGAVASGLLFAISPAVFALVLLIVATAAALWGLWACQQGIRLRLTKRAVRNPHGAGSPGKRRVTLWGWVLGPPVLVLRLLWKFPSALGRATRWYVISIPRLLLGVAAGAEWLLRLAWSSALAWRRAALAALGGLGIAVGLLLLATPWHRWDSREAREAAAWLHLRHVPIAADARAATAAVAWSARQAGPEQTETALRNGASQGTFLVDSGQILPEGGCIAWAPWVRMNGSELRLALDRSQVRLRLQPQPSREQLLRTAQCNWHIDDHPFDTTMAALEPSALRLDLFDAIETGQPSLVAAVLRGGPVPDTTDWQRRTAMHAALDRLARARAATWSAAAERRQLAKREEEGVRQMFQTVERALPSPETLRATTDRARRTIGFLALQAGLSPDSVRPWLATLPAEVRTASGASLLHAAAASGDVAMLELAESHSNGSPRALTHDGRSPLHEASGHLVALRLIVMGLDPDVVDQRGQTPLHSAVLRRDYGASAALANYSASLQQQDIYGKTAFDYLPPVPSAIPAKSLWESPTPAHDPWLPLRKMLRAEASLGEP